MKISEMTLEQLQDYALELEEKNSAAETTIQQKNEEIAQFRDLNLALQNRNNALLLRVEAQRGTAGDDEPGTEPTESVEEFAAKNFKNFMN